MKREDGSKCKMVTMVCAGLATLLMFLSWVLVFACGLKTFNLERTADGNTGAAPGKNPAVAGFKAPAGLDASFFRCLGYEYNRTASCSYQINTQAGTANECGMFLDNKLRRCLPSNSEKNEDFYNINPNTDQPRYGFLADGSCGQVGECRSGYAEPTTGTSTNFRSTSVCKANPDTGRSAHGVCTFSQESALSNGDECFAHYECKSNHCKPVDNANGRATCVTETMTDYRLPGTAKECDTTQPDWLAGSATTTTSSRRAHHDVCAGGTQGPSNNCPAEADGCYDQICRKHFQNFDTAHRNQIAGITRDIEARKCVTYGDYAKQSPIIGLGFAFLILSFLIPIHTFVPAWFSQRHGGWLIAACVATWVAIYHVHLHYYALTYDAVRHMVDCAGPDDIDATFFMHNNLPAGFACVRVNGGFEFDDIKKYLGLTMHHNPAAMEFLAMVAGFTAALCLATISIGITVFVTIGGPCMMKEEFDAEAQ